MSQGLATQKLTADTPPRQRMGAPISVAVGVATGLLLFASTRLMLRDVDLYWHLRAGREILDGVRPGDIGADWSFAPDPRPWVTTQWLAEVGLYQIHAIGSWSALVAYRSLSAAIVVSILAYSTLRGRPAALAAFPFLAAGAAAIAVSQERPSQATLIGAAALGPVLLGGLTQGRLPRWWLILPLTWIWANYHGGWVLVPGVLVLIVIGRAIDHGVRDGTVVRALGLTLTSLVVGTLTPAGTASTLAVVRFTGATDAIQEWQRTVPLGGSGLLSLSMLGMIAIAWARSRVAMSEAFVTAALVLFSWAAIRNVAPALLIMAPLVANRLCLAFPRVGRQPEPRWSAPLGTAIAVALLVLGLAAVPGRDHLPVDANPVGLAGEIGALPGAQRVLNHYNVAGFVLYFAGPDDQVGIDGRSDRYGNDYIESYVELANLKGDWSDLLSELDPTVALLRDDSPLAHVLVAEFGWTPIKSEGGWVLLAGSNRADG